MFDLRLVRRNTALTLLGVQAIFACGGNDTSGAPASNPGPEGLQNSTTVGSDSAGSDTLGVSSATGGDDSGRLLLRVRDGSGGSAGTEPLQNDVGGSEGAGRVTVFFVSPDPADDSGLGTEEHPFHSIEQARDAIRLLGSSRGGPITVLLRGGRYGLINPFVLEAIDSGTAGAPITYKAYPSESPVVSGGIPITNWVVDAQNRWVASVPRGLRFRQLYVAGRHAKRATGAAPMVSSSWGANDIWPFPPPAGYLSPNLDLASWKNPNDIEFGYYGIWSHKICPLASVRDHSSNDGSHHLQITMLQPCLFLGLHQEGDPIQNPDYVENALELLDEPGEWYHDRSTDTLYYMPLQGQQPETTEVVVPVLERLLDVRGTIDAPIHDLVFSGITFAHSTWLRPSVEGHIDVQANFTLDPDPTQDFFRDGAIVTIHNQYLKSPGAVSVSAGQAIRFERCTFTQLGSAALDLGNGARSNQVVGSRFFEISGSGIQVGDVLEQDHHPTDPRSIVKDNLIANNYLHDLGLDFEDSIGVFAGYTDGTVIEHNEIDDLPYTGVSVGWGWGEEDEGGGASPQPFVYTTPTVAGNNRVEYNHIHDIMQKRSDGGGVYTLGIQPNTIIRANYIHDGPNACGVYLDEGSGFIEVTENLVDRVIEPMCLNNLHQRRDETCSIHGNSFDAESLPDGVLQRVEADVGIQPEYQDILQE